MLSHDNIQNQQELLATHRSRLTVLLEQHAMLGKAYTPPGVVADIKAARADIRRIKAVLRASGVTVDDAPNDDPSPGGLLINNPFPQEDREASHKSVINVGGDQIDGDKVGGDKVLGNQTNVNTGGGDYAEGNIDKSHRVDASGDAHIYGPVVAENTGTINYYWTLLTPKVMVILIVAVGLTVAGAFYIYTEEQRPARMTGKFNIAVAQFGEVTANGITPSVRAAQISQRLFDFLDSTYKMTELGQQIQVEHKKIGVLMGDREAEQLAHDINAQIVIYGNLSITENEATLFLRFYVTEQRNISEITGQYQLARPIRFNLAAIASADQIDAHLQARAATLVQFTEGMVYYLANKPNAAIQSFQKAVHERAAELGGLLPGDAVLYFFLGEAYRVQGNLVQATTNTDIALKLNSGYSRAYVLRGNIYYMQALPDFDKAKLAAAGAAYQMALEANDQPPGSYITEKVHVALGNVYAIQAQQQPNDADLFTQATAHFQAVTTEYEETQNEQIKELVAIAYFGLGAVYERHGDDARARDAYQRCMNLTGDSDLKSRASRQLDIINKS